MPRHHIFMITIVVMIISCTDYKDDFTSGSFYPVDPQNDPETGQDSTIIDPPLDPRECWDSGITARHNSILNDHFTRYGNGWTGGDATYSIPVDERTTVWLFGDSFLGTVRQDRSRPSTPLIRNSIMLQVDDSFTTFHGGSLSSPSAFLSPLEEQYWYWPGHGQVVDGQLQVVMFAMKSTGAGGGFGFEYAAIDLITLTIPEMQQVSNRRIMDFQGVNFGACILNEGGQTYIFGAEKDHLNKYLHIAKVNGEDLSTEWTYYTGNDLWSNDVHDSKRIFSNVSEQFSVIKRPNGFYLVSQNHILGKEIYIYHSSSVEGPYDGRQTVYCTPESEGNIFTYNAFVHDQFSSVDKLLISYNNNSFNYGDLFTNADNYRPHFVNIEGWYNE